MHILKLSNKKPRLLMGLVVFVQFLLNGQTVTLNLKNDGLDGEFKKLMLVNYLFYVHQDTVAEPLDIAADKINENVKLKRIILPNYKLKKSYQSWTYGYFFNGNVVNDFSSYNTLYVTSIGDVGINLELNEKGVWDKVPTLIWVDRNNNFDLSDEGDPDTLFFDQGKFIPIAEGKEGYGVFIERWNNTPGNPFQKFYNQNNQYLSMICAGNKYRKFVSTENTFRERRMNLWQASWRNGADSFLVGIKDQNCNGKIGETGNDLLMIGFPGDVLNNLQGMSLDKNGKGYLEWNNCAYYIEKIDNAQKSITIRRDSTAKLKYSLNKGEKIPRFKYVSASKSNRKRSIRKMRGKYTYIYVWRDDLEEYKKDTAFFHDLGRQTIKEFAVLGLNNGSNKKFVGRYNARNGTQIVHGFSSNSINKKIKVKRMPYGILVDKKQRIIACNLTPEQALDYVKKMQKK